MSQIPGNNNYRLMDMGSGIVSHQRHTFAGVTTLRVFRSKRMRNTDGWACYILVKLTSQTPWFAWFFNHLRSKAFANLQLKKQQPGDQLKGGAFSTGCWSVFTEIYEWSHLTGKPPGQNLHESMGQHGLGAIDTWWCSLCRNYYLTKISPSSYCLVIEAFGNYVTLSGRILRWFSEIEGRRENCYW